MIFTLAEAIDTRAVSGSEAVDGLSTLYGKIRVPDLQLVDA
jgi:hypothetical protein